MPEIITKYPEIVIQIIKVVGKCGAGVKQQILTTCPPERFCSLPTGEICVYGLEDIPKMTQISTADLAKVVSASTSEFSIFNGVMFFIGLVVGAIITYFMLKSVVNKKIKNN
jgi:hypothetical protein